jgi:flagellar biosynthesis/type III secretory pathway protein FliH
MQTTIRALVGAALVVTMFGAAVAKLPPPPPQTEEQKAAAAAKASAAAEAEAALLAKAQDRAVAHYIAEQKAKGHTVTPQMPSAAPAPAPAKK